MIIAITYENRPTDVTIEWDIVKPLLHSIIHSVLLYILK